MYPKSEHRNEGLQLTGLDRLAEKLPEQVDAGLIISPINRRYYTGFLSSAGVLVVMPKKVVSLLIFCYYEHAKAQITDCEVILCRSFDRANGYFVSGKSDKNSCGRG